MPVLVTLPTGGVFGPGFGISVFSDNPNVLPPNSFWRVHGAFDDSITQLFGTAEKPAVGHSASFQWQTPFVESFSEQGARVPLEGDTVFVQGELSSGSTIIDVGQTTGTYHATAGLSLQYLFGATSQGRGGGTVDQAQLDRIEANQQSVTPTPFDLNRLFQIPPLADWLANLGTFTLTGRGTVAPPMLLGASLAVGLWFQSVDVPPSLSVRDGFIQTYLERIGQFVMLNTVTFSGREMAVEFYELRAQTAEWTFPLRDFNLIGYDVLPGCVVHCQWVTLHTP